MLKVKDGYAKLIGTNLSGSIDQILLSNGGITSTSNFAKTTHSHVWTDISNRPTAVSAFTNDKGYLTSHLKLDHLVCVDLRNLVTIPTTYSASIYPMFMSNSTDNLKDGGIYHGILHWRSYGAGSDLSGGYPILLAYTANANLWLRIGTSSETWGAWQRLAKASEIPTKISDLTDDIIEGTYLKLTGGTMKGAITFNASTYNPIGTNMSFGSSTTNTFSLKSFGSSSTLEFLNAGAELLALITASKNILTTTSQILASSIQLNGTGMGSELIINSSAVPYVTYSCNDTRYGYIGIGQKDSFAYRVNTKWVRYLLLDTSNTYVTNGIGLINGTPITYVDSADYAKSAGTADLANLITNASTNELGILDDDVVKFSLDLTNDLLILRFGSINLNEAQLALSGENLTIKVKYADGEDWGDWISVITTSNFGDLFDFKALSLFTSFTSTTDNLVALTIGKVTKKLTIPYAVSTSELKTTALSNLNDVRTNADEGRLYIHTFNKNTTNIPTVIDNANALLTIAKGNYGTDGMYCNLLLFLNSTNILYRYTTGTSIYDWVTILTSANYSNIITPYITNIDTSTVNLLKYTLVSGATLTKTISVNTVKSLGRLNVLTDRNQAYSGIYTYSINPSDTEAPALYGNVIGFTAATNTSTVEIAGNWISGGRLYWRALRDITDNWWEWKTILDSSNYTSFINSYYWANVNVSTTSNTTTTPQFGHIGVGAAPSNAYSIVTSGAVVAPSLMAGGNGGNTRLIALNADTYLPSIGYSSTDSAGTKTVNCTFKFDEDSWLSSNSITVSNIAGDFSVSGYKYVDNTKYTVTYLYSSTSKELLLNCTRIADAIKDGFEVVPEGQYQATVVSISVTITINNVNNYYIDNSLTGSFLRACDSGAAIGYLKSAYIINNDVSYDVGMSCRYMSAKTNLFPQPVLLGAGIITATSSSTSITYTTSMFSGQDVFNSITRSSAGKYTILTNLSTSLYATTSLLTTINARSSVPLASSISYNTSGVNLSILVYLAKGTTFLDDTFQIMLWYINY